MAKVSYASLVRMIQFPEPLCAECQIVAKAQLFAHLLENFNRILRPHLFCRHSCKESSEGIDMRPMLFLNRFKSETSVKRFVKGGLTLTKKCCGVGQWSGTGDGHFHNTSSKKHFSLCHVYCNKICTTHTISMASVLHKESYKFCAMSTVIEYEERSLFWATPNQRKHLQFYNYKS